MSRYTSIWKQLKDTGHCAITAPTQLHRRIVRGVIKDKDEDLAFKLQQTDIFKRAKLTYLCEGNRVRFFLTKYVRLDMVNEVNIGGNSNEQ